MNNRGAQHGEGDERERTADGGRFVLGEEGDRQVEHADRREGQGDRAERRDTLELSSATMSGAIA